MSGNIFNTRRFLLLFRQHFIHNNQFLWLSAVAYIGAIFIVLSIAQIVNEFKPHNFDNFQGFLIGFGAIFGVLYVGHSFPAFRSKESTINYLMMPASILEKFLFELVIRIGISILVLPLLYWMTFHMQGYIFTIFSDYVFEPYGLQYVIPEDVSKVDNSFWRSTLIGSAVLLAFILAFTGATMFTKQPLVKSLFSVAVVIIFYVGYSYIVVEHFGLGRYNPPDSMWLLPMNEVGLLQFLSAALILSIVLMLFVAYRKLKEREV